MSSSITQYLNKHNKFKLINDTNSTLRYNIPLVITFGDDNQRKVIASMITEGRYFRRNITFQITEDNAKIANDILNNVINAVILYKTSAYFVKDPNIISNYISHNIQEVSILSNKKRLFSTIDD